MGIVYANNGSFSTDINDKLVIVDFYADWCGPCKMLEPILDELAKEIEDLKVVKVDVDEYQEIASEYDVMSMPTMLLFKEGKLIDQKIGLTTKEDLQTWIGK
ncbi:MAG: thioredoxin [Mycoplasmatales bacterium]